jgi:hypothetical protein
LLFFMLPFKALQGQGVGVQGFLAVTLLRKLGILERLHGSGRGYFAELFVGDGALGALA